MWRAWDNLSADFVEVNTVVFNLERGVAELVLGLGLWLWLWLCLGVKSWAGVTVGGEGAARMG